MAIAAPTITSATRVQGSWIALSYTAGASGYTRMYYELRTATSIWSQATSETNLNGSYTITTWAGSPLSAGGTYWVRAYAMHSSGEATPRSNEVQVGPWVTPTPDILAVTRIGEKAVKVTYTGAVSGGALRARTRKLPDGQWTTLAAVAVAAGGGDLIVSVADGNAEYAVDLQQVQHGVTSGLAGASTVEAWWQKPPAATIGAVTRALDGAITVPFTGSPTARAPWTSIVARWLVSGSTSWQSRTLSGSARTVHIAADPVRAVTVEIEPRNAAGPATSAASTTVAASMVPP